MQIANLQRAWSRSGRIVDLAKHLVRTKMKWRHPISLTHAVTARCNAKCGFCAWSDYDGKDELTTAEAKALYTDARDAGFMALSVWGGEPLVRADVADLIGHAKHLGLATHLVTNGRLLARRLDEVAPVLDRISISFDHPTKKHDEWRGVKGLSERIIETTRLVGERYPEVKIAFVYTLMKGNSQPEALQRMADLVRSLGVQIAFNAMRVEAASDRADEIDLESFNPSTDDLDGAFAKVRQLKEQGYPILNSYSHLDKMTGGPLHYNCHWPKFMLPIEHNGDVVDCMHWGTRPVGNIRETPFTELLEHPRLRELAGPEGEACHKCVSLHRVEISEIWQGNLEPAVNWWRSLR